MKRLPLCSRSVRLIVNANPKGHWNVAQVPRQIGCSTTQTVAILSCVWFVLVASLNFNLKPVCADDVAPQLPAEPCIWTGSDLWANPMEDWQCSRLQGEIVAHNLYSGGDRELVLLTAELNRDLQPFRISAMFQLLPAGNAALDGPAASAGQSNPANPSGQSSTGQNPTGKSPSVPFEPDGFLGFQIGLQGEFEDYRDAAIYGTGFCAGVTGNGELRIGGMFSEKSVVTLDAQPRLLVLEGKPNSDGTYDLTLTAGEQTLVNRGVRSEWLSGLVSFTISSTAPNPAVIRNPRPKNVTAIKQSRGGHWTGAVWQMRLSGEKVSARPERSFGPIYWCQHTLESGGKLNLTAQFAPVMTTQPATLWIDGQQVASELIDANSRVAQFRIAGVDSMRDHTYAVRWNSAEFIGTIRHEPMERDGLTIAVLSCNDSTGFPHNLLVANVGEHRPDVIAFLGDQIYEPIGGYGLLLGDNNTVYDDRTAICYLRKFAMHGWTWRELLRETPSVTIPDDHDVFHGNIWGAGGKLADRTRGVGAEAQDSGGYKMSADFVNVVHRTQTGSLPLPFDPTPALNGISVYYTAWRYAGIDMAILADRQFKSAPQSLLPESRIRNGWPQNHDLQRPALIDPRVLDIDNGELLGQRQEQFLQAWATGDGQHDWRIVFSQTPLMTVQTIPADQFSDQVVPNLPQMRPGEYPDNDIPKLDYDSNGWPQSRRNRAVQLITQAHAVHVTGDQHLGSTGQYGIDQFNDSAWWVSSPAIANLWPRRWFPKVGGANRRAGAPQYTGEFLDGFGNRVTLHAVANPFDIDREPSRLFDRAVGYTILNLDRDSGQISVNLWPYYSAPGRPEPDNRPYPGWPVLIDPKSNKRVN